MPTQGPTSVRSLEITEAVISLRHIHPEARDQLAAILRRTIGINRPPL